MKTTPLTQKHEALGAKMVEFAGYSMPMVYTGISDEHEGVRKNVGIFDVSHMGEFIIRGKDAAEWIQHVTSNNVKRLEIGQAQYSCLPNAEGGIIDDLLVYRLSEDNCSEGEQAFMLVVNASNIDKDRRWIESYKNGRDAILIDISDKTGLLAVQGPKAIELLAKVTDSAIDDIKYYHFEKGQVAGVGNVLISATGYTGSGGFELYVDSDKLGIIWDALFAAGEEMGVMAAGLGARDTLRLEMGFCLYGNDIDDSTSPIEAGLGWITKTKKGEFVSQEIFARQRVEGVERKLVGFTLEGRRVPRQGYAIEDEAGNNIGRVTSGSQSPSLGHPLGLGYVPIAYSEEGTKIWIAAGSKKLEATVTKLPFYKT